MTNPGYVDLLNDPKGFLKAIQLRRLWFQGFNKQPELFAQFTERRRAEELARLDDLERLVR